MNVLQKVVVVLMVVLAGGSTVSFAQTDTTVAGNALLRTASKKRIADTVILTKKQKDSVLRANHIPRKATRRSAIIPGWGQAYNREYWKIPIVYGVLAIPTVAYIYNQNYYKKTRFAFEARLKEQNGDSSDVPLIDPDLKGLGLGSLQNYRNSFRRDRDYSILWFLLAWGLQVVDATVFAHLRQFNISSDLSMQVHPQFNPASKMPSLSLSLNLREPARKAKVMAR
ncbi:MAG TPA: DUF5683 domain-containing protein [Sediminibacterium sp.]|nr:DUF5683 domain-containing protein [Sediminibacterium sp.]